jgi:hypothetical protein
VWNLRDYQDEMRDQARYWSTARFLAPRLLTDPEGVRHRPRAAEELGIER